MHLKPPVTSPRLCWGRVHVHETEAPRTGNFELRELWLPGYGSKKKIVVSVVLVVLCHTTPHHTTPHHTTPHHTTPHHTTPHHTTPHHTTPHHTTPHHTLSTPQLYSRAGCRVRSPRRQGPGTANGRCTNSVGCAHVPVPSTVPRDPAAPSTGRLGPGNGQRPSVEDG